MEAGDLDMRSKVPRTMFVTNSLTGGGAERATNILVNALVDSGVPVSLVTVNYSAADLVIPRCEVFELNRPWQGGPRTLLAAYYRLRKIVKKWSPQVIVFNCDVPELLGSLLLGKQIKVAVEHASQPWVTRKYLGKVVRLILTLQRTRWVAVSSHLRIWPNDRAPDIWINNAIMQKGYQTNANTDKKQSISDHKICRLVYVGRLSKEKQPEWVLEIAKQTGLPAIFFGDGRLRNLLSIESSQAGVLAQFPGFVTNPWDSIMPGDLVIIPSVFEGDGLVLVESIAHQVPLLVNAIPDLLRFNLPKRNYCDSPSQFVQRITRYSENILELRVPGEDTLKILEQRMPEAIAGNWRNFLITLK